MAHDVAPAGVGWRPIALLAAAVLGTLAMYGVGVLLPYYVNDLHRLPLAEVASGAHDPKDLWPGGALGGFPQLAGFLSLALLPMAAFIGICAGATSLVFLWRRVQPQRLPKSLAVITVMAASVAALAFLLTPTGEALAVWRLD